MKLSDILWITQEISPMQPDTGEFLSLFQLVRGYCSHPKFDESLLPIMYELVKNDLRQTVQRDLQLLARWRLGDPVHHHQIIIGILTLSLSAPIVVDLPDGQRITGSLESLGRSSDNMVKLFVQGCDGPVAVEEKFERVPFLWTGHGALLRMYLTVEDNLLLPPYWFVKPFFVPALIKVNYLQEYRVLRS
jgi:hypothetical protein